jgi:hypothetical protein
MSSGKPRVPASRKRPLDGGNPGEPRRFPDNKRDQGYERNGKYFKTNDTVPRPQTNSSVRSWNPFPVDSGRFTLNILPASIPQN